MGMGTGGWDGWWYWHENGVIGGVIEDDGDGGTGQGGRGGGWVARERSDRWVTVDNMRMVAGGRAAELEAKERLGLRFSRS